MGRAWRIEYEGALYHLMSRGSDGKTRANISDAFLDRLSRGKGRIIITASSASEVSKESRARQEGQVVIGRVR